MKIAILVLAAATVVVAQSEETSRTAVERAISDVEIRFQSALAKRDRAELEKLLTNGFMWVHASGLVEPRSVFIAQAVRGMALTSQQAELARFEKTLAIYGDTVVATGTARNRFPDGLRETWFRQVRVYVKEADGWKFAYGQGTPLYNGPFSDPNLYRGYAGTYVLRDGRVFKLEWNGDALMATAPTGGRWQMFLKSPTETTTGDFLFVLDGSGRPSAVRFMRGDTEVWRAERKE